MKPHYQTSPKNFGLISVNDSQNEWTEATIIVCGPARSGTTMVATILSKLGITLGSDIDEILYEDTEIRSAILSKDEFSLKRIFDLNNQKNKIWGWKYPGSLEMLDFIARETRNPHFIFTSRDPVAIACRNAIAEETDPRMSMIDSMNYMRRAILFSREFEYKSLFVSYEKAIKHPEKFVQELFNFLPLKTSAHLIRDASKAIVAENSIYQQAHSGTAYIGWLDHVSKRVLSGWAWKRNSTDPLILDIFVDDEKVASITSDKYREDLKFQRIGNGFHAFEVNTSTLPNVKGSSMIDVRYSDNNESLLGAPKAISKNQTV